MKTNPNDPIIALDVVKQENGETEKSFQDRLAIVRKDFQDHPPLTKREYFASLALQGILANPEFCSQISVWPFAKHAVNAADMLIAELNGCE
jgi:hypothetical protein